MIISLWQIFNKHQNVWYMFSITQSTTCKSNVFTRRIGMLIVLRVLSRNHNIETSHIQGFVLHVQTSKFTTELFKLFHFLSSITKYHYLFLHAFPRNHHRVPFHLSVLTCALLEGPGVAVRI